MVNSQECKALIKPIGESEKKFLLDESKFEGMAHSISFPTSIKEVIAVINECVALRETITIQGGLTGITGSGVPIRGHILNMKKMNRFLEIKKLGEEMLIKVEAGITFDELEKHIRRETKDMYFLPSIPTEKTATVGGGLASGASGIQSYRYGKLQDFVEEIELCTAEGKVIVVNKNNKKEFSCFLNSEGMIGVIVNVTMQLVKKQPVVWGLMFPFKTDENACQFVDSLEGLSSIAVMEYMDCRAISIIEEYKPHMNQISNLPDFPENMESFIYMEVIGDSDEKVEEVTMKIIENCIEAEGDPDQTWAMTAEADVESLRHFRHAVSECINMKNSRAHAIDSRVKKLSADIRWTNKNRIDIIKYYKKELENAELTYCIFGHIGTYAPYVNIVASNAEEYQKGKKIMRQWIRDAYNEGAIVFCEHGVGKIKKEYFSKEAPIEKLNLLIKAKIKWDKNRLFNPENMFVGER